MAVELTLRKVCGAHTNSTWTPEMDRPRNTWRSAPVSLQIQRIWWERNPLLWRVAYQCSTEHPSLTWGQSQQRWVGGLGGFLIFILPLPRRVDENTGWVELGGGGIKYRFTESKFHEFEAILHWCHTSSTEFSFKSIYSATNSCQNYSEKQMGISKSARETRSLGWRNVQWGNRYFLTLFFCALAFPGK